jgi:hypothetical protein
MRQALGAGCNEGDSERSKETGKRETNDKRTTKKRTTSQNLMFFLRVLLESVHCAGCTCHKKTKKQAAALQLLATIV